MTDEGHTKLAQEELEPQNLEYWRDRALFAEAEIIRLREDLERLKIIPPDPLTGLPIMEGFEKGFKNECLRRMAEVEEKREYATAAIDVRRHYRNSHGHFMVVVDVDGLKGVNDNHEDHHAAGDSVLRALASVFRHQTRTDDLVVRRQLGGDEFLILFTGTTSIEDVKRRMLDMRHRFERRIRERFAMSASFSFGVAEVRRDMTEEEVEQAVRNADAQMYEWKQGRGLCR